MGCTYSKKKKKPSTGSTLKSTRTPLPAAVTPLVTPLGKEKTPVQQLPAQENLVSAPAAHSPAFEETGKELGYEQKRWCKQELEEWRNQRNDSNEPSSFNWPSAYEKRAGEMKSSSSGEGASEQEKETPSRAAKREEKEKMAFLNRRLEERNHRRAERFSSAEDDTLFEQPTRMPNMDFLIEKHPA